ncbi:MAG TPA: BamA/TamA family outer membrane protein, partial [Thermoanaerobaculia bacterium]|nr:BamA/TamA family outer membrane protein [Thermoanaerobaculia bacterium]
PELVERKDTKDQVADVVVRVNEGDQYKVGRIEFEGNDRTMDKVLRRELRLQEGRVVSIGAVRNSITKVNQLGYFKLDESDPVKIDYDGENKQVNLVFKGEEAERTELQFGGGWSEFEDFFGQFAINTKNFLGRGEQVGVSLQAGGIRDVLDVSYFIPWFMDRPQSLGFRAFDQELDYDIFTAIGTQRTRTTSRGGTITYGRNLGLFQQMSASYNRTLYEDEARILGGTGGTLFSRLEIDTSSVRPIYVYDSRDNPFEPTRGRRLTLATEYAGGFLGGDSYFVRPELTFSLFQPLGTPVRQVFAFNVEAGLVDPFEGRELTRLERFYLGGENSIRGHRSRSITVRDPRTGERLIDENQILLGGDRYLQVNLEYHFLLGGPFRILLFADAAQVYGDDQSFDLSRLRYTAGAELRVLVPVFGAPLRFIYAFNLDEQPGDQFEDFQFSIGTSF